MGQKSFEWKLALGLDKKSFTKEEKALEKEIQSAKKSFESLNKIKAFTQGQADLKSLEAKLSSARTKMAEVAEAGKKTGAALQSSYKLSIAEVDKLSARLSAAKAESKNFIDTAGTAAKNAAREYGASKEAVAELSIALKKAREESRLAANAAKKGSEEQKSAAAAAKIKVAKLSAEFIKAKNNSKLLSDQSKQSAADLKESNAAAAAKIKELSFALLKAKDSASAAAKAVKEGASDQQQAAAAARDEVVKLEKEIRRQTGELAKHSAALKASGVSTRKIAEEQKRAELAYKATSTQLKASAAAQRQYDALGIRSSKQIRAEQAARVEARRKLAASGKATAADLRRADAAVAAGARQVKAELAGVQDVSGKAAGGIGKLAASVGAAGVAYGALQLALGAVEGYKVAETAAFNLETSILAANREFGNTGSAESWGKTIESLSAKLKVYSGSDLDNAVSKTVDMTKRLGFSEAQMAELILRTGDLGAGKFELGDSIERVTAAMRGEAEASEALGLTLSETYVKSWYEARGSLQGAWKDLNDVQKAQVRFNVFLEQSTPFAGKAAASLDTLAGAGAKVRADIEAAQKKAVEPFLPALKLIAENAYLAGRGVDAMLGTVNAAAAVLTTSYGIVLKFASGWEAITDYVGITDDTTKVFADNSAAAFASAEDLAGKAKDNFKDMAGAAEDNAAASVSAADQVAAATGKAAAAVKESADIQKISLEEAKKEWLDYAAQIRDIEQQIEEIGSFGGGSVSGLQQVNGEWQYFATNADKAKAAMEGFNNTSQLGISSLKDKIFELSLVGKDDLNVWESRRRAAEQYTQAAKATAAEAQQLAQAGQQDEANRKFAQSIEIAKKAEAAYKSLATEVKSEWTPAMEAAHKKASEGVKKYEKEANKALSDAAKHYDKARAAGEKLADKQADLADKLREVGRAGMAPAAAYQDMTAQAREYEAAARAALAAGDFEKAVELAGRAESAWDSLGNEVKDGERTVVSAKQALADQASGIKSAGQVAIDALKAQQAAEEKAAKAAEEKAKKATAAKEAEAAKVKALEVEKEKVIISAEEGAQEAAAGTVEANQLLVEILDKQKTAIGEVADALNRQADWSLGDTFTDAGESLKAFDGSLKEFDGNWGDVWSSMQTKGEESIQVIEDRLDRLVAEKRVVTVQVKEVTGSASGSIVGAQSAATGKIVSGSVWKNGLSGLRIPGGPSMVDTERFILARGETVTSAPAAAYMGYDVWRAQNRKDEVGAAKAMVARFPALKQVFGQGTVQRPVRPVRPVIMPQYMTNPLSPATPQGVDRELKALLAGLQRVQSVDYVDGSQYDYLISQQANEIREARKARHASLKERLSR